MVYLFNLNNWRKYVQQGGYDLIIAGTESIDYNGGMVPGMLTGLLGYNFVNACIGLEINGTEATVVREIDGGKRNFYCFLPLIIAGKKGLSRRKRLANSNMRGIMTARTKSFNLVEPTNDAAATSAVKFEKPALNQQ